MDELLGGSTDGLFVHERRRVRRAPAGAVTAAMVVLGLVGAAEAGEPITDWSAWERYRDTVAHPASTIKAADLARARENIERYEWAQTYADRVQKQAEEYLERIDPAFVEAMIPRTTPGPRGFTPCPACRDQNKPQHPHGQWSWSVDTPDQMTCQVCDTVFPNERYAETVTLTTTWGEPQTLTFYGGEPFKLFSYEKARPSFTGMIRNRQVNYMAGAAETLAEAYALSGEPAFAEAVRLILSRLAAVYPNWLVTSAYGEIADMDPRIAAEHIEDLPEPELVYPPNEPDHVLHRGYWSAQRVGTTGSGQDGRFIRQMAEAYDLTCDAVDGEGHPIYTEAQRIAIERDLLLEGTYLLTADRKLNNKSVANRTGVAVVGMTVGHPELVRFGLEGFRMTVDDWFLSDGFTPESPAYASMTLGGVVDAGQAFRGYSDPPGYTDEQGKRIEGMDLYQDPAYANAWEGMFLMLQGDLRYPPFADSYVTSTIRTSFVEYMAGNYPDRPQYLALLKELYGEDLAGAEAATALYYREPGLEDRETPPLTLPDVCPPALRIGFMRTGEHGRDSLLLLSASHWGGHHHFDSLNLYYWKNGHELLSDLGYLWDHPDRNKLKRTFAHNLVLIDGKNQIGGGRGGEVLFFATSPRVKTMRASSQAYAEADVYERTAVLIDHGQGRSYAVDVFRVSGGQVQDYVFHGPNQDYVVQGLTLRAATSAADHEVDPVEAYGVSNVKAADGNNDWQAVWTLSDTMMFTARSLGDADERVLIADGWGQRDHRGSDVGATLPYVIRRTGGNGVKRFVSVFEGHAPDDAVVQRVQRLTLPEGAAEGGVALMIETTLGRDYVVCRDEAGAVTLTTPDGPLEISGRVIAASVREGDEAGAWSFSDDESAVHLAGKALRPPQQ